MSVLKRVTLFVGSTVMVCLCQSASAYVQADSISPKGFASAPSVSESQVDMRVGASKLRIPRNYLESAFIARSTGKLHFTVVATIPDLHGATSETLNCFQSQNWRRCPVVVVRTVEISARSVFERYAAEALRSNDKDFIFGLARLSHVQGQQPGIYLVAIDDTANEHVAYSCTLPTSPLVYCRGYLEFSGGLRMMYQFSPDHLSQWRIMHIGLRDMFSAFRQ